MTDLSGTPAEQVRALGIQIGDTIETRIEYCGGGWTEVRRKLLGIGKTHLFWESWNKTSATPRWVHQGEHCHHLYDADWRKISSDPTLDPAEPLRREPREAYRKIESLCELTNEHGYGCSGAEEWLDRNAAFGGNS